MKKRLGISLSKGRGVAPTSIAKLSKRSPQLDAKKGVTLNRYTTKNAKSGCYPHIYNTFINNRLAYQRAARGGAPDDLAKLRLGPKAERLTKENYNTLKKGQKIYYDRGSVYFRGPFTFQRLTRGPILNFTVQDAGYDITYLFSIKPSHLAEHILYIIKQELEKTVKKTNSKHKTRRKKKHRKHRIRRKKKGGRRHSKRKRRTRKRANK